MTDRELLEKAAKAAGIEVRWHEGCGEWTKVREFAHDPPRRTGDWDIWSPLADDGDALRLAVKLRISVYHAPLGFTLAVSADGKTSEREDETTEAATRRAIVRAAAAIEGGY
jgi:hypothetical protein